MLKKNQDSYKRSMDICAHAGFEPKVIMYFDQLQTAYNVARSGQSGIIFFRDALLKYTGKTLLLQDWRSAGKACNPFVDEALSGRGGNSR